MEAFYQDYRDKDCEILALSQDDAAATVVDFMARENYHFPVALADASSAAALGGVSRLPTSFVSDKRGVVRHKISGQVHYARLKALVEPLLAE